MQTLTTGDLKNNLSQVINDVKKGNEFILSFGRKKEKVAVIVPYSKYIKQNKKRFGVLEGKAEIKICDDFKMSDEELLKS